MRRKYIFFLGHILKHAGISAGKLYDYTRFSIDHILRPAAETLNEIIQLERDLLDGIHISDIATQYDNLLKEYSVFTEEKLDLEKTAARVKDIIHQTPFDEREISVTNIFGESDYLQELQAIEQAKFNKQISNANQFKKSIHNDFVKSIAKFKDEKLSSFLSTEQNNRFLHKVIMEDFLCSAARAKDNIIKNSAELSALRLKLQLILIGDRPDMLIVDTHTLRRVFDEYRNPEGGVSTISPERLLHTVIEQSVHRGIFDELERLYNKKSDYKVPLEQPTAIEEYIIPAMDELYMMSHMQMTNMLLSDVCEDEFKEFINSLRHELSKLGILEKKFKPIIDALEKIKSPASCVKPKIVVPDGIKPKAGTASTSEL